MSKLGRWLSKNNPDLGKDIIQAFAGAFALDTGKEGAIMQDDYQAFVERVAQRDGLSYNKAMVVFAEQGLPREGISKRDAAVLFHRHQKLVTTEFAAEQARVVATQAIERQRALVDDIERHIAFSIATKGGTRADVLEQLSVENPAEYAQFCAALSRQFGRA